MNPKFKGVYAVTITPFKEDGSLDIEKSKAHLDYLIDNGIKAVCILGATGEYQSVTLQEHQSYVREIVPYIRDRVTVMVGATRERADDVIELVSNIKDCGADCAMVLSPPYCHPRQKEVVEHYRYIMEKTQFPLVVYNNPGSCGISIERDTFKKLFALPYTAVIKESSGCMQKTTEVVADAPENVSVFCGCDTLAYESFAVGACGWISMMANVAPKDCVALFEAVYERHDLTTGWEIYKKLLPGLNILEGFGATQQVLKYILNEKTGNGGYSRRPHLPLTDEEKVYVWEQMRADIIE